MVLLQSSGILSATTLLKDLQVLILLLLLYSRVRIVPIFITRVLNPIIVVVVVVLGGDVLVESNDLAGKFRVAHIDGYVLAELLSDLALHVVDFLQTCLQGLSVHLLYLILLLFHALHFLAQFLFKIRHAIHILQSHVLVFLELYHTHIILSKISCKRQTYRKQPNVVCLTYNCVELFHAFVVLTDLVDKFLRHHVFCLNVRATCISALLTLSTVFLAWINFWII